MNSSELQRMIKSRIFPPILLLFGEEEFLIQRQFANLKTEFLHCYAGDAEVEQFSLTESSIDDICTALRMVSMFSTNRLFVIKEIDKLKATDQDVLLLVMEKITDKTVLVLLGGKVDKKRKYYKAVDKRSGAVEFKKLYDNQIPAFIRGEVKGGEISFSEDGLQAFCKRVGQNLNEIDQELQKLFIYCSGKRLIDKDDVLAVVSSGRAENVFALAHEIAEGKRANALEQLEQMLDDGEPPVKVLALIVRHFRQLWKIRAMLDSRSQDSDIAKKIRINPYFFKDLKKQALRFGGDRLYTFMPEFLETDVLLKSSNCNPKAILEALIFSLTRK